MKDPEGGFACRICGVAVPHRHYPDERIQQSKKAVRVTQERDSWKSAYPLVTVNCHRCGECFCFHRSNVQDDTDGYCRNPVTGNEFVRCPHCNGRYRLHLVGWNPKAGIAVV